MVEYAKRLLWWLETSVLSWPPAHLWTYREMMGEGYTSEMWKVLGDLIRKGKGSPERDLS